MSDNDFEAMLAAAGMGNKKEIPEDYRCGYTAVVRSSQRRQVDAHQCDCGRKGLDYLEKSLRRRATVCLVWQRTTMLRSSLWIRRGSVQAHLAASQAHEPYSSHRLGRCRGRAFRD